MTTVGDTKTAEAYDWNDMSLLFEKALLEGR